MRRARNCDGKGVKTIMFANERKIAKDDVIEAVKQAREVVAVYDKKWRWFRQGDSQQTSIMLDFMMDVEYRSGTLIFIPDADNKFGTPGNTERNADKG